jgi:cytoskeletal protein CcmA (bactofilin family)
MMLIRSLLLAAGMAATLASGAWAQHFGGHVELRDVDRDGDLKVIAGSAEISGRIGEDLAVFGGSIVIDAQVEGDIRVAGGNVTVTGTVGGDAEVAGGSVELTVDIGDSAEFAGGYVEYSGTIGGSLDSAAGVLEIAEGSVVTGPADMAGQSITLRGHFLDTVEILAQDVVISGRIDGDVEIEAEHLTIEPGAVISGRLEYFGPSEPDISPDATLANGFEYTYRLIELDWDGDQFSDIDFDFDIVPPAEFFAVSGVAFSLLLGLLALVMMPKGVIRLSTKFRKHPLLAPLIGLFLLPMGWIMLMTAGTVLLFISVVGIILIPFWWVFGIFLLLLAYPLGAIAVGDCIFNRAGKPDPGLGMRLLGMAVVLILSAALWILPPLAVIASLILSWIGLGSWMLAAFGRKGDNGGSPVAASADTSV